MTARPDDDALSWDGDDNPTLDVAAPRGSEAERPDASTGLPAGYTAVGRGSEALSSDSRPSTDADVVADRATEADDSAATPRTTGNVALVGLGILAGVYLLLTIGWLLGAARLQLVAQLFLEPIAFQVTLWLAVLALPLWFLTVLWLTRGGRTWVRVVLLVAGAVLLIPWPFVLAGATL